jgi:ABC-type dipeptide/oligopeptide/nickel transport system permease component/ABC-type transport system substrate-binding protein
MRERLPVILRVLLRFAITIAGFVVALYLFAWLVRPDLSEKPLPYTRAEMDEAVQARKAEFDPTSRPTLHVQRAVEPRGDSPLLAEMARAGKLPPLRERMPAEPTVLRGADGIGRYGGTWMRIANGPEDVAVITWRLAGATLMRWSPLGYPLECHVAKSVEPSDDNRVWTVTLRRGMKWSDGSPYTADDIVYWWEQEIRNPVMQSVVPNWMMIEGREGRIEKVDDLTVRFVFPLPYATFRETLASTQDPVNTPAHYLRRYHPDPNIGDASLIARDMAAYKLPSARSLYSFVKLWNNPEHPRLWPWVYRTFKGNPPQVFVRNPYYFVVDEAGNQLPYIDRVQFDVQDNKMLSLTAANGGVSMQKRHIRFSDYTELMSRRSAAGTRILHWYAGTRSNWVINPNLNRRIDPDDPDTTRKAELLSDKRFRQALSLAINRDDIIKAEQFGIGEPSQVEPGPRSPFYSPKLAQAFIENDPARANAMLDEVGLARRDSEGFRTFRDGARMTFHLDYTAFSGFGPTQFIVDNWAEVGVRVIPRERSRPLFYTEKDAMEFDFNVWTSESEHLPLLRPRYFIPDDTEAFYCVGWARWHVLGGFFDNPRADVRGAIPVPRDHPMYQAMQHLYEARRAPTLDGQVEAFRKVTDIVADNLWTIGLATAPPQPVVIDKHLRNVPEMAISAVIFSTPSNAGIETYFFDNAHTSPGAASEIVDSLITPKLRPGAGSTSGSGLTVGRIVRWLVVACVALLLLLIALRHPFIGRRVLIMVPTLGVISIIVFTIIQLPPGDFLQSRLIQLRESGDPSSEQAIEDLKRVFHYEEPVWKLYFRWTGLKWFTSFSPDDEGLLQGNLGRSMETQQPINNMVGDRIMLTVVVSLATILFTWAVAIPIGIYSAVRQYSLGDYALTLIGFVGMCVPPFLLALVLMAVSGASGLFSPEYAAQPEWSLGKVLDLLGHIWIPVVVLGVGGTASMIRVMRANLLEELKKPYVITAMAKGVRPFKLLMKYPVRLALNPFVSGIGGLFPQLVSGGAIVSMVLALPMVGPLLLQALFTEDMYLAGSMLMVLSLLGVVGTLVSDLLLVWLDPRIRFEGGSR